MISPSFIRFPLATALLWAAGCAAPPPLRQTPLSQGELDPFLASGRDARELGITIYPAPAGTRFANANRPHAERTAQLDFVSPRNSPRPVVNLEAPLADRPFPVLLDSSARQNWAVMSSLRTLDFRAFKPPLGEYADHVVADIPGYAGAGRTLLFDTLHVEYPVFHVPPARGGLGPLARVAEDPDRRPGRAPTPGQTLARRMPAVVGSALLQSFAGYVRFDFPRRSVVFSSSGTYRPAGAVRANLPMLDWRGRPAIQATLDGAPLTLVIDTAGDFDLAFPGEVPEGATGTLAIGGWSIAEAGIAAHAALGLPEDFPARLGLGVLARGAVTLDYKNRRVWFEGKTLPGAEKSATSSGDETAGGEAPVHYRGITR